MMNRAPNDSARAISTNWRCSTVRSPAGRRTSTSTDQAASSSRARLRRRPPADEPGAAAVVPVEEQVLGDGQLGDDGGLLVDAGDVPPPGVAVGQPRRGLAAERTAPASGACRPVRIDDQRRLAGAVAADQRVRLAGQHGDAGAVQRHRGAEPLGDADRLARRAGRRSSRAHLVFRSADVVAPQGLVVRFEALARRRMSRRRGSPAGRRAGLRAGRGAPG